jgi:predicted ester cyclase
MSEQTKATARRFFAEQDRLHGQLTGDICAEDYTCYVGSFPPMDRESHNQLAAAFWEAFPDLYQEIEEVIAEGDRAAVRFRIKGTNTGALMGNPPTGQTIDVGGVALVGVEAGKVTELREEFDQLGLMQQIGLMPAH